MVTLITCFIIASIELQSKAHVTIEFLGVYLKESCHKCVSELVSLHINGIAISSKSLNKSKWELKKSKVSAKRLENQNRKDITSRLPTGLTRVVIPQNKYILNYAEWRYCVLQNFCKI